MDGPKGCRQLKGTIRHCSWVAALIPPHFAEQMRHLPFSQTSTSLWTIRLKGLEFLPALLSLCFCLQSPSPPQSLGPRVVSEQQWGVAFTELHHMHDYPRCTISQPSCKVIFWCLKMLKLPPVPWLFQMLM